MHVLYVDIESEFQFAVFLLTHNEVDNFNCKQTVMIANGGGNSNEILFRLFSSLEYMVTHCHIRFQYIHHPTFQSLDGMVVDCFPRCLDWATLPLRLLLVPVCSVVKIPTTMISAVILWIIYPPRHHHPLRHRLMRIKPNRMHSMMWKCRPYRQWFPYVT